MRTVSQQVWKLVVATMLVTLVTSGAPTVGATAPGAVGNVNVIVSGSGAAATGSRNTTTTATTYRDAPRVQVQANSGGPISGLGGFFDGCFYTVVGNATNAKTTATIGVILACGSYVSLAPAAYPLWEVQTGTPGRNILVVPPTLNPPNGTRPAKTYGLESFR